ncbi:hydroxyethylthiazole kinase [Lycium ferocissimum]|uniref:hydroxyethylthiazole kinase n=1 Tax=Lycium ferocissimum TaxID=112874 RepID=UPI0028154F50|nr:hydroxyethylthiazole kinase [Lycium ferocissimum]
MEENKITNIIKETPLLEWPQQAWTNLQLVRQNSPLIQCITNFVSMDFMANTLLSAGASPAMIHSIDEIPEFTPKTLGVCINAGTLTPDWLRGMMLAAQVANQFKIPWVLDPVAAGGSSFRLNACLDLLALRPSVVRGNGSEILALFKGSVDSNSKGVDSVHGSSDAVEAAKYLAQQLGSVVAVSGAVDFVTDGDRVVCVHNGVPMLQKITASGCSVTALITAFVAVDPSHAVEATASALAIFGVASEIGMDMAKGPASLRTQLIDSLYGLDEATALGRVRISHF